MKYLLSILFLSIIYLGGLLFIILPHDKVSVNEKRSLSPFPILTSNNYLTGKYSDSIDFYYSDNFLFRDHLIALSNKLKEKRGIKNLDIKIYTKNEKAGNLIEKNKIENNIKAADTINILNNDNEYQNIKSVIVYKNRALQMFSGSKKVAASFSKLMGEYKLTFPDVNVYCMAVPVGGDFYLPNNINKNNEIKFIDALYASLVNGVIPIRAYESLKPHYKEYLQFNTDHHWTGRAAYYAYEAFCNTIGISQVPMEKLNRKVIKGFLGTLYYYTLSPELKNNKDSVEYFKIPYETKTVYYTKNSTTPVKGNLYAESARGGNSYGVFLGGDFPLIKIVSSIKNNKKILVLKDSYGNAFVPYLASHYEEIYVIDYRYYEGGVKNLVKNNNITDILFAHNVFMFNTNYTIVKERNFLK
jgi:hypothetical protein